MRRLVVSAGAWLGATGAAITLSWFGVSAVLQDTLRDPPRALPVPDGGAEAPVDDVAPDVSSTQQAPSASPAPSGSEEDPAGGAAPPDQDGTEAAADAPEAGPESGGATEQDDGAPPGRDGAPPGSDGGPPASPDAGLGDVRTVRTDGGRVALEVESDTARLVSAAPEPGWQMEVWDQDGWIRVTFSRAEDGRSISVFCTFNGHEPVITHYEDEPV